MEEQQFHLQAPFQPTGDQPQAIEALVQGIEEGDILVIDRSLEPANGDLAVCCIDGEFTVKRLKVERHRILLMPSNRHYHPIEVSEDDDFTVWGIVTHTIKRNRRKR